MRWRIPVSLQNCRPTAAATAWPCVCACAVVLAGYWLVGIRQLAVEWSINPQYQYGWAVPFLSAYLVWDRWSDAINASRSGGSRRSGPRHLPLAIGLLLGALFALTRLMGEACPEWRLVSWLIGFELVGLSLAASWVFKGEAFTARIAFPIAFFLAAIPWVRPIESAIVQKLTNLSSAAALLLLTTLGEPVLLRGNLIQTAAGCVGLDEACSGIRSLQACLLMGLFVGEWHRLGVGTRVGLCAIACASALAMNILRTSFLAWMASRQGLPALDQWHGPVGISLLAVPFCAVWLAGKRMTNRAGSGRCRPRAGADGASFLGRPSPARSRVGVDIGAGAGARVCWPFVIALALWLPVGEISTNAWYRIHEHPTKEPVEWTVTWPADNPTLTALPLPEKTRILLRTDEAQSAVWREPDETIWHGLYLRWRPGRVLAQVASDHNPKVCLTAAGRDVRTLGFIQPIAIHGVTLHFQVNTFKEQGRRAYTFHAVSEDGGAPGVVLDRVTVRDRFRAVWQGRRNTGQRVLQLTVWGIDALPEAEARLARQLQRIIRLESTPPTQP